MSEFFQLDDDAPARRVLYACALLLIAVPFVQVVSQIWPLQLGNIQWRFQAANALSSVLLLPFLGLALLLVVARMVLARGISLAVGIVSTVFAIVLAGSLALFVLDALQLKAIVSSAQMNGFMSSFARVSIVTAIFVVVFALLAFAGFKAPGAKPTAVKRGAPRKAEDGAGLIVGQQM